MNVLTLSCWVFERNGLFDEWLRKLFGNPKTVEPYFRSNLEITTKENTHRLRDLPYTNVLVGYRPIFFRFPRTRTRTIDEVMAEYRTIDEVMAEYSNYDIFLELMGRIEELDWESVKEANHLCDELEEYVSANYKGFWFSAVLALRSYKSLIKDRIQEHMISTEEKAHAFYSSPHSEKCSWLSEKEFMGYKLFGDRKPCVLLEFDQFCSFFDKYCLSEQVTEDHFKEWMNLNLSSSWGKTDRNGNDICLVYKTNDEYCVAFDMIRKDNIDALLELPFPRNLILKKVSYDYAIGNIRAIGNVREVVIFCWWMDRMIHYLGMLDTLKKRTIYRMNCLHIPLPPIFHKNFDLYGVVEGKNEDEFAV